MPNRRTHLFLILVNLNVVIGVYVYLTSGNQNSIASSLLLGSFLLLSATYSFVVASNNIRPISFTLILFWCYGMTIPGLYQVRTNVFPWPSSSTNENIVLTASILSTLASICFVAGYFSCKFAFRKAKSDTLSTHTSISVLPLCFILAIASAYTAYAISMIGITPFISTRQSSSILMSQAGLDTAGVGLLKTMPGALAISTFLIAAHQRYVIGINSFALKAVLAASFLLLCITNFPLRIPRFMMISIAAVIGLTWAQGALHRYKPLWYAIAPVLMFLVFPFLGSFNRRETVETAFFTYSFQEGMLHGDFDGFQSLMNVIALTNTDGLAWGGRLISALLFMIPRSIWPDKYDPTGSDAALASGYDFLNISMPLPGELFADFGWVGATMGMFLFGRLICHLDFKASGISFGRYGAELSMLGIITAAYMPILFRGALLAVIAPIAVSAVLVVLWGIIRRFKTQNNKQ